MSGELRAPIRVGSVPEHVAESMNRRMRGEPDPRFGLPIGGNWEGGYRTPDGTSMTHVPWVGWVAGRRRPYASTLPLRRMSWWRRFVPPWRTQ